MKPESVRIACLLVLLAFTGAGAGDPAPADENALRLDPVVVTARGADSRVSQTPGGVGVVTRKTIAEEQPISVTDALRRIPGVEMSSDSPWGSEINIRGLGRNSVVFLIDGCRVNTSTDINGQYGMIHPGDVERIEVLKGPISALYGSGAVGGVVNVITRKGRFSPSPEWRGHAAGAWNGNADGTDGSAVAAFGSPDAAALGYGAWRDFGSYTSGDGETIDNSQFRDAYGKAALGRRWSGLNTTEFQVQYYEGRNIGIPGKGLTLPEGPTATFPAARRTLVQLTHTLSPESGPLAESRLDLFYQEIQRRVRLEDFPAAAPLVENQPGADHATWGLKWHNSIEMDRHLLAAGADVWRWEIGETERYMRYKTGLTGVDSSLGDLAQLSAGLFAEDDWAVGDRWKLNLGGRLDYIAAECDDLYSWIVPPSPSVPVALKREGSQSDALAWTAHAGLTWNVSDGWSVTAIAASSYRAPDLMDRFKYINLGGGVELYGNPDLDPERSLFFEAGLHYVTPRLRLSAAVYLNRVDDLITEAAESDAVRRMANVSEARIRGGEAAGEWRWGAAGAVYADAAYVEGRDTGADVPLPFIPPLNGRIGAAWDPDTGMWGRAEMVWAAAQDDVPDGGERCPGWTCVNLRAGYRVGAGRIRHDFMAGIDNLLDRDYRNALATSRGIELKSPGRTFLAVYTIGF